MSNPLVTFASALVKGLLNWAAPLVAFIAGRKSKDAEKDKANAKVLEKQRDNDVTTIADAKRHWVRIRKRRK